MLTFSQTTEFSIPVDKKLLLDSSIISTIYSNLEACLESPMTTIVIQQVCQQSYKFDLLTVIQIHRVHPISLLNPV